MKASKLLFSTSLLLAMSQAAQAASANWTGLGADSLWTTTGNWSTSPVPGAGDTATFNSAGNGKTTITTAPASLTKYVFDTGASAYTISASSTTWSVPDGGGVTINSGVTTSQNLSGIQFLRPAVNSTVNFDNQGSGTLTLGTIFTQNAGSGTTQTVLKFTPGSNGAIEIASGKLVDNAGTGGSKKISVLLDDDGILKMAAVGTFDGTDSEGNSVTIHRGTYMAQSIGVIGTARTSLGANGRIQLGEAGQTRTATLDYYNAASTTTDRAFYIIDNNTAVFKVSGGASTNLSITSAITQSGSAGGGGKLTKDGVGTLTLTNTSTYTGDTTVSAGTLLVNGALGDSAVTVEATGTFGGTGALAGSLTLDPGASFHVVDLLDPLSVTGSVSLDSTFGVDDLVGLDWGTVADGTYTLIDGTSTIFGSLGLENWGVGNAFDIGGGRSAYFQEGSLQLVVIPEPGAALLGSFGLLALFRRRARAC